MSKPRVKRPPISDSELSVIDAIVHRALVFFPQREEKDIKMDLIACHLTCPLRLNDFLDASDTDFVHDIAGINRHLDHATFELRDCFSPRFTDYSRRGI